MNMLQAERRYSQAALDFVAGRACPSTTLAAVAQGAARVNGINELESTVGSDVDLSLRVLALANSAFYSPVHEITCLRGALIALGADTVQKLAANLLARSLLATSSEAAAELWLHSQAAGLAAQMLAETHRQTDPQPAYMAGLLHDIGLLAALSCDVSSESAVLQHAALGGEIADLLGLSPALSAVIRGHHGTDPDELASQPLNATVYIANIIAAEQGFGHDADPCEHGDAADAAVRSLGLQHADIERIGKHLPERLDRMRASIGETDEPPA